MSGETGGAQARVRISFVYACYIQCWILITTFRVVDLIHTTAPNITIFIPQKSTRAQNILHRIYKRTCKITHQNAPYYKRTSTFCCNCLLESKGIK